MSIDDITKMDLTPFLLILAIAAIIFLIFYLPSYHRAKAGYEQMEEKTEKELKVVSKDLGDQIVIGGNGFAPIKGYRCTFVFERNDGSRLVLKTSNAEVYESIVIGDVGNARHKGQILTHFTRTKE